MLARGVGWQTASLPVSGQAEGGPYKAGGWLFGVRFRIGLGDFEWISRGCENLAGGGGVVLADEDLKAGAGPGEMFAHSAGGVGLDHCGNTGGFQGGLGQVCFGTLSVGLNDDEVWVLHVCSICLRGGNGVAWLE